MANGEYSNFLVLAVFSNKSFSGKISFPVKNSCLPTFSDDEAEILAVFCLDCIKLCFAWFCYWLH